MKVRGTAIPSCPPALDSDWVLCGSLTFSRIVVEQDCRFLCWVWGFLTVTVVGVVMIFLLLLFLLLRKWTTAMMHRHQIVPSFVESHLLSQLVPVFRSFSIAAGEHDYIVR
jgi:hypothetical protein